MTIRVSLIDIASESNRKSYQGYDVTPLLQPFRTLHGLREKLLWFVVRYELAQTACFPATATPQTFRISLLKLTVEVCSVVVLKLGIISDSSSIQPWGLQRQSSHPAGSPQYFLARPSDSYAFRKAAKSTTSQRYCSMAFQALGYTGERSFIFIFLMIHLATVCAPSEWLVSVAFACHWTAFRSFCSWNAFFFFCAFFFLSC